MARTVRACGDMACALVWLKCHWNPGAALIQHPGQVTCPQIRKCDSERVSDSPNITQPRSGFKPRWIIPESLEGSKCAYKIITEGPQRQLFQEESSPIP